MCAPLLVRYCMLLTELLSTEKARVGQEREREAREGAENDTVIYLDTKYFGLISLPFHASSAPINLPRLLFICILYNWPETRLKSTAVPLMLSRPLRRTQTRSIHHLAPILPVARLHTHLLFA